MNTLNVLDQKIAIPDGHFRSKFFVATNSLNNYVTAAGSIFSILERINTASQIQSFENIYDNILHEIKAFASRLHAKDNNPEQDAIAYFLVCATADEMLGKICLKFNINTKKLYKAFVQHTKQNFEPEKKFFEIITVLTSHPENYLDLLELAYYCLTLGYEGIYHDNFDKRNILDNLSEELYQLIRNNRIYPNINLFREFQPKTYNSKRKYQYFLKFSLVTLILATGIYLCDYVLLTSSVNAIKTEHQYTLALED